MVAHARINDPETSHEAAASIPDVSQLQQRLMYLFTVAKDAGDYSLTDEELVAYYSRMRKSVGWSRATDQSIRSRRAELVTKGYVVFNGDYGITVNGRRTRAWRLADRSTV